MIDNVREDLSHKADTARNEVNAFFWIIRTALFAAVIAAIWIELRKPPDKRTWHGRVAGVVPYDFRIPTIERLRSAYWNPRSPKVFTDRPFGVGWSVNVPTLLRRTGIRTRYTKGR
jgi:hypothetical protein